MVAVFAGLVMIMLNVTLLPADGFMGKVVVSHTLGQEPSGHRADLVNTETLDDLVSTRFVNNETGGVSAVVGDTKPYHVFNMGAWQYFVANFCGKNYRIDDVFVCPRDSLSCNSAKKFCEKYFEDPDRPLLKIAGFNCCEKVVPRKRKEKDVKVVLIEEACKDNLESNDCITMNLDLRASCAATHHDSQTVDECMAGKTASGKMQMFFDPQCMTKEGALCGDEIQLLIFKKGSAVRDAPLQFGIDHCVKFVFTLMVTFFAQMVLMATTLEVIPPAGNRKKMDIGSRGKFFDLHNAAYSLMQLSYRLSPYGDMHEMMQLHMKRQFGDEDIPFYLPYISFYSFAFAFMILSFCGHAEQEEATLFQMREMADARLRVANTAQADGFVGYFMQVLQYWLSWSMCVVDLVLTKEVGFLPYNQAMVMLAKWVLASGVFFSYVVSTNTLICLGVTVCAISVVTALARNYTSQMSNRT